MQDKNGNYLKIGDVVAKDPSRNIPSIITAFSPKYRNVLVLTPNDAFEEEVWMQPNMLYKLKTEYV
jgi:hypothetical protein